MLQAIPSIGKMIGVSVTLPEDYARQFIGADLTFKHQSVFDLVKMNEVCLEPISEEMQNMHHFKMYPSHENDVFIQCVTQAIIMTIMY